METPDKRELLERKMKASLAIINTESLGPVRLPNVVCCASYAISNL